MRSMVSKKSLIMTTIFFIILATVGSLGGYVVGRNAEKGSSIKQYLLTEDVEAGHSLKGKFKEVYVSGNTSVATDNLVLNANVLDNGVAAHKMYANSPITVSDVTTLEDLNRNIEVSFPIDVNGSIANSLKPGDVVSIKLTYKDENKKDAVVIPQIKVKAVKSTSGTAIVDENTVVGYVIFDVTSEESSDVNNAKKEGTLYCAKYNDLNQKPLEKTYSVSGGTTSTDSSTETNSSSTNSTSSSN